VGAKVATYTTLLNPHTNYTLVLAPIAEGLLGVSKSASFWVLVSTRLVVSRWSCFSELTSWA
jgi:hypothetical protein